MPIKTTSFSPNTKIKSSEVNTNFTEELKLAYQEDINFQNSSNANHFAIREDTTNQLKIADDQNALLVIDPDAAATTTDFYFYGSTAARGAYVYLYSKGNDKQLILYHDDSEAVIESSTGGIALRATGAHVFAYANNTYDLGVAGNAWKDIHYVGSAIDDSDRRLKQDIKDCRYGLEFVNKLKPVEFRMKSDPSTLCHGFIAQDVEEITGNKQDFVSYDEEKDHYGLRYDELIAPLVKAVQELKAENEKLKKDNKYFHNVIKNT